MRRLGLRCCQRGGSLAFTDRQFMLQNGSSSWPRPGSLSLPDYSTTYSWDDPAQTDQPSLIVVPGKRSKHWVRRARHSAYLNEIGGREADNETWFDSNFTDPNPAVLFAVIISITIWLQSQIPMGALGIVKQQLHQQETIFDLLQRKLVVGCSGQW